jgi:hypothetical protein
MVFVAEVKFDARWKACLRPFAGHFVIRKGLREGFAVVEIDFNPFDKLMSVVAAEPGFAFVLLAIVGVLSADMLEVIEATHDHFATGGGAVVLEHIEQCFEQQFKVGLGG